MDHVVAQKMTHAAPNKTRKNHEETIGINVEGTAITATLANSETARDFVSLLQLVLTLEDYAVTEISNLPKRLSTKGAPSGYKPSAGDVTYYASWDNLAVFNKGFSYSSGLIKLGEIDSGWSR